MAISAWEESGLFDEKDRAVLQYADAAGQHNLVPDDVYANLALHFTQAEIVKLCIAVSFAGLVNRVHATFRTDVDPRTLSAVADAPYCLIER